MRVNGLLIHIKETFLWFLTFEVLKTITEHVEVEHHELDHVVFG